MFRVGLIGCGSISAVHARVLRELEDTDLVACADVIPERARRYGCPAYTDWLELLDREHPDAVHLCTPHYLHPVMAAEAARRGIAVFTEKPPAIDLPGWQQVKAAAERVPVGVCFQNRYRPTVQACLHYLQEGTYGSLQGIRGFVTWRRTADYYAAADWKGRWATEGGGALINQAIHTLDLIIGFLGMPGQIESTLVNHHLRGAIEVEDTAEIYLQRGGVPALLYASTAYSQDAPVLIELQMERAVLRLEGNGLTVIQDGKRQDIPCDAFPALGRSYWGGGHKSCIADFYRSIAAGIPYANDPASCEATMQTLLQLYAPSHIKESTK